ncbi:MAG: DUF368 domain-containing protein, partial [Defluviitaleaceae bacterium]|nr:DUF368 domain-containing protein [Defluviitaleaceae bacterium]
AERKWALPTEARGFGGVAPIGDGNCESSFLAKNKATKYYFIAAFAAIVIILLALFTATENSYEAEGITLSATLAVHLFIGGLFSAAALVIPGISGAMVLMLFGLYAVATHTLSRISDFLMSPTDLEILTEILIIAVPLGLGIVAGILLGSKLIAMLLKKFHTATYFAILGLVLGTIFAIFNNPDTYQSHDEITPPLIAFTAIAFVCGAVASLLLGKKK